MTKTKMLKMFHTVHAGVDGGNILLIREVHDSMLKVMRCHAQL